MEHITERIELYHLLFLICLIGMFLFLLVSVILFIRLDMKNVILYFTGTKAQKEIQELERNSAKSGKIGNRAKESLQYLNPGIQEELGLYKVNGAEIRKVEGIAGITITKKLEDGSEESTELLVNQLDGVEKTTLLQQRDITFVVEREILLIHTDEMIEKSIV